MLENQEIRVIDNIPQKSININYTINNIISIYNNTRVFQKFPNLKNSLYKIIIINLYS